MISETVVKINLARILFPVNSLGPGNRIGIWLCGCPRRCEGCANPELWETLEGSSIDIATIKKAIESINANPSLPQIDGVTISGGEPFYQPEGLEAMVEYFEGLTKDILIFTGYKREELSKYEESIISKIAVLVDGEYQKENNMGHPLRGSDNQQIHYINAELKSSYEKYIEESKNKPMAQIFPVSGGQIVAGIHKKDFQDEYDKRLGKDSRVKQWQKI